MVMTLFNVSLLYASHSRSTHTPIIFFLWLAGIFTGEILFIFLHDNCWQPDNGPDLSYDKSSGRIDQDITDEELERRLGCFALFGQG